jgi:diguanylate cyclase (GGDEF)-like protein
MLNDSVITLGLRGGKSASDGDQSYGFLVAAMTLVRDLLASAREPERAAIVEKFDHCLAAMNTGGAVGDVTTQVAACLAEGRSAVDAEERQRGERAREMASLMAVVHETMAAAGAEMSTLQTSLQKSTERFDAIRQIDDPRIIKARLVTEVIALKQVVLTRRQSWEQTERQLSRRVAALERQLRATQHEASKDPLTGIANRRTFERTCDEWITRSQPYFAMALLDVDDFKLVNDTHGHAAGDKVLQFVARTLATSFRSNDLVARIGGDEFAVLASGLTLRQAEQRMKATLEALSNPSLTANRPPCTPPLSCGLVEYSAGDTAASLFERADEALYSAKKTGKNCLIAKRRTGVSDVAKK